MNCPVCNREIVERNGKFGSFLCCPSGKHGTFSIQNGTMYYTGEVGLMFAKQEIESTVELATSSRVGYSGGYSLTKEINRQLAYFGYNAADNLTQLADFAIGDPGSMYDEDELNDPDNWWNMHDY